MGGARTPFSIRNALPEDAADIKEIAEAAYAKYIPRMGKRPAPMDAEFARHIASDTVFIAETDRISGYAIIAEEKDGFWLDNIAVHPAMSGHGLGSALISRVETHLSKVVDRYRLYTNVAMTENQAWYEKLGFVETHRSDASGFERIYYVKVFSE